MIKNCFTKDFIEKNIQDTQPAEAVGATKCSQNSATCRAGVLVFSHSNYRESRVAVRHETRTEAKGCSHVDLVWTTKRQQDQTPTTTGHQGTPGSRQGHPRYTGAREGTPWVAQITIHSANAQNQKNRHHCLSQITLDIFQNKCVFLQAFTRRQNQTINKQRAFDFCRKSILKERWVLETFSETEQELVNKIDPNSAMWFIFDVHSRLPIEREFDMYVVIPSTKNESQEVWVTARQIGVLMKGKIGFVAALKHLMSERQKDSDYGTRHFDERERLQILTENLRYEEADTRFQYLESFWQCVCFFAVCRKGDIPP